MLCVAGGFNIGNFNIAGVFKAGSSQALKSVECWDGFVKYAIHITPFCFRFTSIIARRKKWKELPALTIPRGALGKHTLALALTLALTLARAPRFALIFALILG
jgi:hypothetical protein